MNAQDDALRRMDVSRETLDRFRLFERLLQKWNRRINLVSRASLDDFWRRHVADSVQVFRLGTPQGHWVDLGSGGGFPGLVVAILAASARASSTCASTTGPAGRLEVARIPPSWILREESQ